MIARRQLLLAGAGMALSGPLRAARAPRIYMILFRGETGAEKGFRDYLASQHIEVELIVRDVALDVSKIPALVQEARELQVDMIYAWGTPVALAVAGRHDKVNPAVHVTDIPVVFTMVASPVGSGLVRAREGSGRNITGASHVAPIDQQLSAMRTYRPFKRIGMLYNPAEPNSLLNLKELRACAAKDGFTLVAEPVLLDTKGQPMPESLPGLVAGMAQNKVQMLYTGPDSFLAANRKIYTEATLAQRIPTFCATEGPLRDGKALFGLVSGYESVGRLTAYKAVQILQKKMAPGEIPIETLARFSYLVNMSVAAALDFYPPLKVINYAELLR